MTVIASIQNRNLVLRLSGVDEPFVIPPLPGRRGKELTETYLKIASGIISPVGMDGVLAEAVGSEVQARLDEELSLAEQQSILMPAFLWQTVLGMDGVNTFLSGGEGLAGAKKGLELLLLSLGLSLTTIAQSSELETQIQSLAPTPPTTTPPTGKTIEKLPPAKRSRNQSPKKS
ncbi:hypothetical protein [Glaciihabitans sp. dw_435]|uniref:hypothetical protein n=1 Tax=Glaciihabitans sp. dw_435 TaxID=2720081 RepID=UPI001BD40B4C|nr:hypothetical protein [Glaciihabitans sp. dw_435]